MEELLLPLLVVLTSAGAYVIGVHALGLSGRGLGPAMRQAFEMAGLTVVFLIANLALGLALVLASRALSMPFVSVYILKDVTLVALSALQGVVFAWWRREKRKASVDTHPASM
jgi:hypothetical protein